MRPIDFKSLVKRVPVLAPVAKAIHARIASYGFVSSSQYWERRYQKGRTSGSGSYGRLAHFKAEVLNDFISANHIESAVEFGCGDGAQLSLVNYPIYLGIDVSPAALGLCRRRFANDVTKTFALAGDADPGVHDMALSLDVIYHLVEDDVFDRYMKALFRAARRFVVIYSSNSEDQQSEPHVRHRVFTRWIEMHRPDWRLHVSIRNPYPFDPQNSDQTSFADFYVFARRLESEGS
jgi:hypothetical protein